MGSTDTRVKLSEAAERVEAPPDELFASIVRLNVYFFPASKPDMFEGRKYFFSF